MRPMRARAMPRKLSRTESPTASAPTSTALATVAPSKVPKWLAA